MSFNMCDIVYHSEWEKLIWIGLRLQCPICNQIEDTEFMFIYNDMPLMEYLNLIIDDPGEYCAGPPFMCCHCGKALNQMIVPNITQITYIQPVTRMKRINL